MSEGLKGRLPPQDVFALRRGYFAIKDNALGHDAAAWASCYVRELADALRPARVGTSGDELQVDQFRGDRITWLSEEFEAASDVATSPNKLFLALKAWRSILIESLRLNVTKTSVQLARYEGNGARYVRHSDVNTKNLRQEEERRLFTVVYYLNPLWTPEDGGQLRIYVDGVDSFDVEPISDRMVIFPSHLEHEVLPSHGRPRWAVTMWLYGPQPVFDKLVMPLGSASATNDSIFVSIACFRDRDVFNTIKDLFSKAREPSRVFIGVCWQGDEFPVEALHAFDLHNLQKQVKLCLLPTQAATGPLSARNVILNSLYSGERYILQIDAHSRFAKDWDSRLIADLLLCPYPKAILTGYPAGFRVDASGESAIDPQYLNAPSPVLCADRFDENGMLRIVGRQRGVVADAPVPCLFWAAGFSFSRARAFFEGPRPEVPYLFFGEETLMAYYFYSHGWQCFAPSGTNVIFHLWQSRSARPETALVVSGENKLQAMKEYRRLLDEHRRLGRFEEYERHVGVDFRTKEISERAKLGGRSSWAEFRIAADLPKKALSLIDRYLH